LEGALGRGFWMARGAANLIYCSCCRFGTVGEDSCLSRELQTWATAVGCSSGTWAGSSCLSEELQTWSTAVPVGAVPEMAVRCAKRKEVRRRL